MEPRGRYAPSPTGEIHLGNASTALLAWLSIRSRDGRFVMRMEDLDQGRVGPGLADRILGDLRWFGIDWDEGPDMGGPHPPYDQWSCLDRYRDAFEKLAASGRLYPCFCSRKDIAAAASAPQTPGDERRYPETCRELDPQETTRRIDAGRRHAFRFKVGRDDRRAFEDLVRGNITTTELPGDFVVQRSDGIPAYQLAVVCDDAEMGITEVVRGDDLLLSTVRQLLLFEALGYAPPAFGHVPLLLGADGARLSKRHQGITLRELWEAGLSSEQVVGRLAWLLKLRRSPDPVAARELVAGFSLSDLEPVPAGVVIDPAAW